METVASYRVDVLRCSGAVLSTCIALYLEDSLVTALKGGCGKPDCKTAGGDVLGGGVVLEGSLEWSAPHPIINRTTAKVAMTPRMRMFSFLF
jgi:hypothetical protein